MKNCSVAKAYFEIHREEKRMRMNLFKIESSLLLGSAISLSIGGFLLYAYSLVPAWLLELTAMAIVILLPLAYLVSKRNMLALNISTILGVVAPIVSASTPSHLAVLFSFGQDLLLSFLGLLQIFGFYLFPIIFVVLRLTFWKNLRR
ncbi:MAG: hypothetical protein ACYCQJ_00465 [Nitrososphaerales archaeon]